MVLLTSQNRGRKTTANSTEDLVTTMMGDEVDYLMVDNGWTRRYDLRPIYDININTTGRAWHGAPLGVSTRLRPVPLDSIS